MTAKGLLQNHLPYPKSGPGTDEVIAWFRDPRKRLTCAFNDNKHSFGLGEADHSTASEVRSKFVHRVRSLRDYVKEPDIKSCQTKMLLGEYCAIKYDLDRERMSKALKVLRSLKYIGIADYPGPSACLFHHMFGGPLRRSDFVDKDLDMLVKPGQPLIGGGNAVSYSTW